MATARGHGGQRGGLRRSHPPLPVPASGGDSGRGPLRTGLPHESRLCQQQSLEHVAQRAPVHEAVRLLEVQEGTYVSRPLRTRRRSVSTSASTRPSAPVETTEARKRERHTGLPPLTRCSSRAGPPLPLPPQRHPVMPLAGQQRHWQRRRCRPHQALPPPPQPLHQPLVEVAVSTELLRVLHSAAKDGAEQRRNCPVAAPSCALRESATDDFTTAGRPASDKTRRFSVRAPAVCVVCVLHGPG